MNISITKRFTFESAHHLPNHNGKCRNIHGHSYILEVTVSGPIIEQGPQTGMVMDFAELSAIVDREVVSQWDHKYLNDILPFDTTAENLAVEIMRRLSDQKLPVTRVRLWETAKCYAEVTN